MIKKIFLLLLFSLLGTTMLTHAEVVIPKNGWKEGKYYIKLDNTSLSSEAECELSIDGDIFNPLDLKKMAAWPNDRYIKIKLDKNKKSVCKRLERKFSELTITLNVNTKWGDSKSEANKTDLDSIASQIIQTKYFKTKLKPQIEKFGGEELSREKALEMVKKMMLKYDDNGEIMGPFKHVRKTKRCIVPINDTLVISYKIKKLSSLDDFFALDSTMVDVEVQNENPTLTYIDNLWQTYKQAIAKKERIEFEPIGTGRRAYQEFINKLRTEIVPAIIDSANKSLPEDCSAEIRHLLENRLKIAYYSENPMNLFFAQEQQFLADAFTVFQDIEFDEDMLYELPTACKLVNLIGKYTGILPAERRELPSEVIQMLYVRGLPYNKEKSNLGYQIGDRPVQEWCQDVKEILNKYSFKANDFLVEFMTIPAYDRLAADNYGLNKKQVDNIKSGYKTDGGEVPLKTIQMEQMGNGHNKLLRIK